MSRSSTDNNPCLKEHSMSLSCLDKNDFDKTRCENYFNNYNTCKSFWGSVQRDRRRRGIEPHLPSVEDREKIKAEYLAKERK